MKARSLVFTAVALLATSAALADAPEQSARESQPRGPKQTLLENLADGMRELLRAVAPEISLPQLELELPSLDLERG
jgi:hypothetical protein